MGLTQAAKNARPKKPLTYYFKFRGEKLEELKDDQNKVKKVTELWNKISEKDKQRQNDLVKQETEKWKVQIDAWKKKYNVTDDDLEEEKAAKKKSKKGKSSEEEKPAKTKGDGKREKSNEKGKDAKSKGKDDVKKQSEVQTKNKDKKKRC